LRCRSGSTTSGQSSLERRTLGSIGAATGLQSHMLKTRKTRSPYPAWINCPVRAFQTDIYLHSCEKEFLLTFSQKRTVNALRKQVSLLKLSQSGAVKALQIPESLSSLSKPANLQLHSKAVAKKYVSKRDLEKWIEDHELKWKEACRTQGVKRCKVKKGASRNWEQTASDFEDHFGCRVKVSTIMRHVALWNKKQNKNPSSTYMQWPKDQEIWLADYVPANAHLSNVYLRSVASVFHNQFKNAPTRTIEAFRSKLTRMLPHRTTTLLH